MSIKHYRKSDPITIQKLKLVILGWLDQHETDLVADFKPESEAWRQQLAEALAIELFAQMRNSDNA